MCWSSLLPAARAHIEHGSPWDRSVDAARRTLSFPGAPTSDGVFWGDLRSVHRKPRPCPSQARLMNIALSGIRSGPLFRLNVRDFPNLSDRPIGAGSLRFFRGRVSPYPAGQNLFARPTDLLARFPIRPGRLRNPPCSSATAPPVGCAVSRRAIRRRFRGDPLSQDGQACHTAHPAAAPQFRRSRGLQTSDHRLRSAALLTSLRACLASAFGRWRAVRQPLV